MRPTRHGLAACAFLLALAAPASASELVVVGEAGERRIDDPHLPPRAATDLTGPRTARSAGAEGGPSARSSRGPSVRRVLLRHRRAGRITEER